MRSVWIAAAALGRANPLGHITELQLPLADGHQEVHRHERASRTAVAGHALAELELASGRAMLQLTLVIHHDGGGTELGWDAAHAIARMHDALQTASVRAKAPAEHEVCIGQARV